MARALFKSWFVDFDPVRAKAEGRDPGLPQPLADLFPARLVDSELGEIPEGWEVKPLPEIIEVNPPRTLRKGDVAPYLDMANMPKCGHTPDSVIDRPFGSGMRFMNGDTLVARITPCLENGKTAYVDFLQSGQVGWGSTEYIVLRPEEPLPAEFAYCLARSVSFRDFAIQSMTGSSGRQRVPAESLDHFLLPASPEPIARVFGRAVAPIFARASEAAAESRTLAALRDALLPKLISGALRVKDAEMFIANFVTVICTDDAQNQSSSL
jgi:type I restriction enzyme S subunit